MIITINNLTTAFIVTLNKEKTQILLQEYHCTFTADASTADSNIVI